MLVIRGEATPHKGTHKLLIGVVFNWSGLLVDLSPFAQRVVGSNPALAAMLGTLGKSFTHNCPWRSGVKL